MTRRILTLSLATLFAAAPGFGQVLTGVVGGTVSQVLPTFSYSIGNSVMDQHGNVLVFDSVYTVSPLADGTVPTTGVGVVPPTATPLPIRPTLTPKTRVTVIPGGSGQPLVKEYDATFQIIGAGKSAVYAVVYSSGSARKLIAIDAGTGGNLLPTDLSGFLSAALTSSSDVRLNPATATLPDTIYCVDPASNPLLLKPTTMMPIAASPRIARTIKFDGIRFTSVDVVLPQ